MLVENREREGENLFGLLVIWLLFRKCCIDLLFGDMLVLVEIWVGRFCFLS